jgi:single-strand selective monofunctional uracil DNA glycosylase
MPARAREPAAALERIAAELRDRCGSVRFGAPVAFTYNPLDYAWDAHRAFLRMARPAPRVLFVGMNPGPFGMAQTGVPFGEVGLVRDFLGIEARVDQPQRVHPRRPIEGFACGRSEVSGRRFWGWARERFGTAAAFSRRFLVANYCPLVFMEASGKNRTPDKLPAAEQEPLFAACDAALRRLVEWCDPERVIGVGRFAADRAAAALGTGGPPIASILHPSPASPAANRDWAGAATKQLVKLGVWE